MLIGYSNKQAEKLCNNSNIANRKLGSKVSKKLFQRLQWLAKAPNLDFFNTTYKIGPTTTTYKIIASKIPDAEILNASNIALPFL